VWLTRVADGVGKPVPFVDLRAILQAGACWRAGVNVYQPSTCLHGGVFNYSPFLLRAAYLPLGPRDTETAGVLLCLAFFISLSLLPRPASRREFQIQLAGALSASVFYALDQGNFDVAIFVITVVSLRIMTALRPARSLAYAALALAAAAKFYPAAALVTVLREPFQIFALIAVAGILAGGIFLGIFGHDIVAALRIIPSGTPFRATFGAIDLPRGLNLLHILTAAHANAWLHRKLFSSSQAVVTLTLCAMTAAALACMLRAGKRGRTKLATGDEETMLFLTAGAAIISFCFFAAQNVSYRAIFLLLVLPGLARCGRRRKWLTASILLLLWEAPLRDAFAPIGTLARGFWLFREILWWWVVAELGGLVFALIARETARLRVQAVKYRWRKLTAS
jgi:hypothetical protein